MRMARRSRDAVEAAEPVITSPFAAKPVTLDARRRERARRNLIKRSGTGCAARPDPRLPELQSGRCLFSSARGAARAGSARRASAIPAAARGDARRPCCRPAAAAVLAAERLRLRRAAAACLLARRRLPRPRAVVTRGGLAASAAACPVAAQLVAVPRAAAGLAAAGRRADREGWLLASARLRRRARLPRLLRRARTQRLRALPVWRAGRLRGETVLLAGLLPLRPADPAAGRVRVPASRCCCCRGCSGSAAVRIGLAWIGAAEVALLVDDLPAEVLRRVDLAHKALVAQRLLRRDRHRHRGKARAAGAAAGSQNRSRLASARRAARRCDH